MTRTPSSAEMGPPASSRRLQRIARCTLLALAMAAPAWVLGSLVAPAPAKAGDVGVIVVGPGVRIIVGDAKVRRFGGQRFYSPRSRSWREFRSSDRRRFRRGFDSRFEKRSWRYEDRRFDRKFDRRFDRRFDGRSWKRADRFERRHRGASRWRSYRYKSYGFRGSYGRR